MDYILEVDGLTREFMDFKLNNISFKLEPGYIMGFIGANGAGKTTTIKIIMNLLKKDSGEIKVFGKDHIKYEKSIKDRIGFVYDESHFYENFTIEKMKNVIAPFYTQWDEKLFLKYMKDFNLNIYQRIKNLSKGMKMKFSLGMALSHNADFIIMDEPTSGLDPIIRRELLDILYEVIQDEEKAVFFSTHTISDLEKIADYIAFIDRGEMVFTKTIDDVFDDYKMVKGDNSLLGSINEDKFVGFRRTNIGFEGLIEKSNMEGFYRDDILIESPSLEDIMYFYIKGKKDGKLD